MERKDAVMMAACGAAIGTLVPVLLHQVGILKHLPDPPPGSVFDSDGITESKAAHPMGVPDALLGLGSYGLTMGLLVAGRRPGVARRLLGWKLGLDGAMAAFNVVRQVVVFGKVCSWCTGTAVATGGMVWAGRGLVTRGGYRLVLRRASLRHGSRSCHTRGTDIPRQL